MLAHAVDYGPVGPVDYASGARCGLRFAVLAVDFSALRARAHISGPVGPVDFPALRARAQEMRGDSNQARGRQAVF